MASSLTRAGAEKQFIYLAKALRAAGVDARVFYLSHGGCYEEVLRTAGVPVYKIFRPGRAVAILVKLVRALLDFKPHLVVASQFCDIIHATLAGRFNRALTIGGVRSDGFWESETNGWRSPFMMRMPHALVANSHKACANLATLGVRLKNIHLLANVIDLQEFAARQVEPLALAIPKNRPIALAIGRLHPDKRFDRFLDALTEARRKVPALFGVLVGRDEGSRDELEQRAKRLGLWPNHFLLLQECFNVPALLAQAHFLVLSSDKEGMPNIIMEAMAARMPVIATPAGDAALLVQHNKTGYVVGFDDVTGMADYMVRLANSPSLSSALGRAGRETIQSDYEVESLAGRALNLFHRIGVQCKHEPSLQRLRASSPAVRAHSV